MLHWAFFSLLSLENYVHVIFILDASRGMTSSLVFWKFCAHDTCWRWFTRNYFISGLWGILCTWYLLAIFHSGWFHFWSLGNSVYVILVDDSSLGMTSSLLSWKVCTCWRCCTLNFWSLGKSVHLLVVPPLKCLHLWSSGKTMHVILVGDSSLRMISIFISGLLGSLPT